MPSLSSLTSRSTCSFRVSSFFTKVTQQIHSLRARGVRSSHAVCAALSDERAFRTSVGTSCTVPLEMVGLLISLLYSMEQPKLPELLLVHGQVISYTSRMKKLPLLLAVAGIGAAVTYAVWPHEAAVNPDPNHTHMDFAVWIKGEKIDFSGERYMSEAPVSFEAEDSFFFDNAYAHEEEAAVVNPKRKYLHLHDGNGNVIHSHKPGQTIGDFFDSIDVVISKEGLNLCMKIPDHEIACEDEVNHYHWVFVVNGEQQPFFDTNYVLKDLDKLLIILPRYTDDERWEVALETYKKLLTDDACLYSRTCPERGEPPTENCIADPAVPCVDPALLEE